MIALIFPLLFAAPLQTGDSPRATPTEIQRAKELFIGEWKIASLTEDGEQLGSLLVERKLARGGMLHITERLLKFENPESNETRKLAYRLDPSKNPRQIDVVSRDEKILPGIYRFEGDSLVLCVQSQETGTRPDKFEAPQGSGRMLVTLKLDKTAKPVVEPDLAPPANDDLQTLSRARAAQFTPAVRRAHELLAGNWDIVSMVDDGENLGANLVRAKFAENSRIVIGTRTASLTSPVSGERRVSAIFVDPTTSPSQVNITNQFDQVLKGIYRFDGDHLKLCVAKDEDTDRPTDFTSTTGSNRLLFDLKMAPASPKPEPVREPAPVTAEVTKARPMVQSNEEKVRERLIGSWTLTDRRGKITFVIRSDGSFSSTRNWRKAVKRIFEGGDTISSGRWYYSRGILSADVTRSTDFGMAGNVLYGHVQSIGDQTMVIRTDVGELQTFSRLR